MRDLTSLLTVVSTCAATIIAIMGGFISSRLINIIDERKKLDSRIEQIELDISLKIKNINDYEKQVVESYAYEFLLKNITELIDEKDLKDVFNIVSITIDEMYEYWEKGKQILDLINDYILQCINYTDQSILNYVRMNIDCNKNDLEIIKSIIKWVRYRQRQQSSNILLGIPSIHFIDVTGIKSRENKKVFIEEKKLEISWLNIEKQNLINEKEILQNPMEEIKELKVFRVLVLSMLVPMIMLIHPYTKNYTIYLICCIINILLFCIGFSLIVKHLYERLNGSNFKE